MAPKNAGYRLPKSEPENIDNSLRSTIDSMGEGFALFGPDDHLVYCNEAYLRIHPLGRGFIQPGVLFEDIIRENIKQGYVTVNVDDVEAYVKSRLKQHRNPKGPIYRRMADGASVVLNECRTPDGSTLMTITNVTELKEIEEELRGSEALALHMLGASPVGVTITTREGKHLFANQRALEIQGVTREELFNSDAASYYADPSERKRIKDKLYKTGATPPTEVLCVKPDGTRFTVVMTSTLVEFKDQKAHLTYLYDITERKKTEAALKESEALLNDALESIADGVVLLDNNDRFVLCNSTYRENLKEIAHLLVPGTPYKEMLQVYADEGLNMEAREDSKKYVRERMKRHKKLEPTTIQIVKTGDWIMLREYRTSDGGTLIVRTDMTDRIKVETALKASEERLTDITEAALDHFWEMGPDLRFSFISENFFLHTNSSPEIIFGKTRQEFVGPETVNDNPELWKAHQERMDNRLAFRNFEYSKRFDDGKRRFFSVSGKPIFEKDGNFMGYRGASTEITEYRRAEQELTHHKKMESLGYLAGGMAHNLNNMLLPILILGQMTKDNLSEESPDYQNLEIICRAAANAQELVARISGFSRQQGLDRKSTDIHEIIRDGLSLIASIVPSRITLKEDLDKNTGTVYLDSTQTQTVLINLIANAVDAMEGKEGVLTVTLCKALVEDTGENFIPGLLSGLYAKLSVTDTGHGMDEETLNRIFDPFFTTKEVKKGTGLGLSTAFGAIYKHGGTIRAFSTVGKGTTFEIYLPLEEILDTVDNHLST